MCDCTQCAGRKHDLVVIDKRILVYTTEDIAARNMISNLRGEVLDELVQSIA